MRVILFILGLLFSADGLYFASTTSMGVGEAFTVAIGIMFILWSTFYDAFKTKGFLKFIKGLFTFGMIVLVIYSGIICVVGKSDNATYREDYIIVLGAGLKGDTPSLALEQKRKCNSNSQRRTRQRRNNFRGTGNGKLPFKSRNKRRQNYKRGQLHKHI